MVNTLSTYSLRHKYFQVNLQQALYNALIAEKICTVDRTDLKTIENVHVGAKWMQRQREVMSDETRAADQSDAFAWKI